MIFFLSLNNKIFKNALLYVNAFYNYSKSDKGKLAPYLQSKSVRFDDVLDDQATGQIGQIRRKLKADETKSRRRTKVRYLCIYLLNIYVMLIVLQYQCCSLFNNK